LNLANTWISFVISTLPADNAIDRDRPEPDGVVSVICCDSVRVTTEASSIESCVVLNARTGRLDHHPLVATVQILPATHPLSVPFRGVAVA
jgi:hypothetical protein